MAASSPERGRRRPVLVRATLLGLGAGIALFAGGALVLYQTNGLLTAMAGVVATFLAALAAGLWAGAPGPGREESRVYTRWLAAGLAVGAAGVFATALEVLAPVVRSGVLRIPAVLFLVALPAYAVGFLLPAFIGWAERMEAAAMEDDEEQRSAHGVVAVGVLLGMAVGMLLAGTLLVPKVDAGPLLLATAALLTSPVLLPWALPAGPEEHEIHRVETPFGTLRVVEVVYPGERQPERLLSLDDENESGELVRSGAPTFAYIAAAERWLAELAVRGEACLFLGGGAYTLPRRVAERDPSARITVVERDPEVTRAAYRWFGVRPEHGIVSVHGDARAVVEGWEGEPFDRVFVDVYDGRESLPYSLVTEEAFAALRRALRPDWVLGMNVIGVAEGEGALRFWSTVRTLREGFPSVALYAHLGRGYPERQNFLLAASAGPARRFPDRAGLFERWPAEEWPELRGTVVFRDRVPEGETNAAAPVRDRGGRAGDPA